MHFFWYFINILLIYGFLSLVFKTSSSHLLNNKTRTFSEPPLMSFLCLPPSESHSRFTQPQTSHNFPSPAFRNWDQYSAIIELVIPADIHVSPTTCLPFLWWDVLLLSCPGLHALPLHVLITASSVYFSRLLFVLQSQFLKVRSLILFHSHVTHSMGAAIPSTPMFQLSSSC